MTYYIVGIASFLLVLALLIIYGMTNSAPDESRGQRIDSQVDTSSEGIAKATLGEAIAQSQIGRFFMEMSAAESS